MANEFVRIPPDSTGKKIHHTQRTSLKITDITYNLDNIEQGTTIIGNTSSVSGSYRGADYKDGNTFIYIAITTGDYAVGETLRFGSTTFATVESNSLLFIPTVNISDPDVPTHKQHVDSNGSAYVRYSEGDLGFDAFGVAQFSQLTQMDHHIFRYMDDPAKYYDYATGGGSLTHNQTDSTLKFSVDEAAGSSISRTTHQYYPYNPGDGNELSMSILISDEGKAGVVRRWGLFDNEDGMFFQLSGTTLSVVLRSSTSGTPVDTVIPRSLFNGEELTEASYGSFILNLSKFNLYWIDYQWLGVGRVRMGVFAPTGKRVTMHTFQNPNKNVVPYTKRGTLPFKIEQFNSTLTSSGSDMKLVCATITRQSSIVQYPGDYITYVSKTLTISGSTPVPLFSVKPMVTFNGLTNRSTAVPTDIECYVDGDPIRMDMIINPSLSGATFNENVSPKTSFLVDSQAVSYTGGGRWNTLLFPTGVFDRIFEEKLDDTLKLSADGVSQPTLTFAIRTLKSGGSSTVSVVLRWKEAR